MNFIHNIITTRLSSPSYIKNLKHNSMCNMHSLQYIIRAKLHTLSYTINCEAVYIYKQSKIGG